MTVGQKVIVFPSTSHAIRAERVLQQAGIKVMTIPVPRQISSDCGIALKFDSTDTQKVSETLSEAKVEFSGIHTL